MDNDTQTLSNMHFDTLMSGLNCFDVHHGKPWQWLHKHYEEWALFLYVSWSHLKMIFKKNLVLAFCWRHDYTSLKFSQQKSLAASPPSCFAWAHMPSLSSVHRHLLVCVTLTQTARNGDSRLMTGDHTKEETRPSRCICGKQRKNH